MPSDSTISSATRFIASGSTLRRNTRGEASSGYEIEGAPAPPLAIAAGSSPHSSERGNIASLRAAIRSMKSCRRRAPKFPAGGCPTCRRAPAPCRRMRGRPGGCNAPVESPRRRCAPPRSLPTDLRDRRPPPRRCLGRNAHSRIFLNQIADHVHLSPLRIRLFRIRFNACFRAAI